MNTLLHVTFVWVLLTANVSPYETDFDSKIVGGESANIKDFPYQLALYRDQQFICGASLLSSTVALTAAHCMVDHESYEYSVLAGSEKRSLSIFSQVKDIIVHPQYREDETFDYDVAVLKIKSLQLNKNIKPIALWESNKEVPVGTMASVSGWGSTHNDGPPTLTLRTVAVPIVDHEKCKKTYDILTPRQLCAGFPEGGKDSCQGDSGGPLVVENKLIGIVSYGDFCAMANKPGVYTKVSSFVDWIKNQGGL